MQLKEICGIMSFIYKLVDMAVCEMAYDERKGQSRLSCPPNDVAKALPLQTYFGISNRQ
ncbi:MAG: hypothetical protein QW177_08340 [Candidatus Nitrosotenuis sp.]